MRSQTSTPRQPETRGTELPVLGQTDELHRALKGPWRKRAVKSQASLVIAIRSLHWFQWPIPYNARAPACANVRHI